MGGFNNPDMTWAQLERALSDRRPRPVGPKENYDNAAASRHRPAYEPPAVVRRRTGAVPYAELHCHSNFSFLDGASPPEELVEQAKRLGLEALALTSRLLVAAAAPTLATFGIPVVSGLTISLDMQITELRFAQSVAKRDALDVSISLQQVPRSTLTAVLGEVADLGLAAATATVPSPPVAGAVPRTLGSLL